MLPLQGGRRNPPPSPYLLPPPGVEAAVYHPVYSRSPALPVRAPPPRQIVGASPAQGGHRRAAANYSLETGEDSYTHHNGGGGGGDFSFKNGGVHLSQSLGDYRLQNGSQLWLNGDYHRQNGGTSDNHNRGRGSADVLRQNGDHADHVLRQNGGNDAKRSSGESASIEPQQHRRLNGDYGQQNGGEEGGETAYPGRSEQYARNWPPVSQSPADKLQTKKVREREKNTNRI
jgi:hypothetical protein